jgi:hypothetical protein
MILKYLLFKLDHPYNLLTSILQHIKIFYFLSKLFLK